MVLMITDTLTCQLITHSRTIMTLFDSIVSTLYVRCDWDDGECDVVCTPLGFARIFTVMGNLISKPRVSHF